MQCVLVNVKLVLTLNWLSGLVVLAVFVGFMFFVGFILKNFVLICWNYSFAFLSVCAILIICKVRVYLRYLECYISLPYRDLWTSLYDTLRHSQFPPDIIFSHVKVTYWDVKVVTSCHIYYGVLTLRYRFDSCLYIISDI